MSSHEIMRKAMALPKADRVVLAQTLWESLSGHDVVEEANRRDEELSAGQAVGRTHEQVMQAARKALE